jgi:hypothetical protein
MRLRITRHTERLEDIIGFYRDRVGLPETGRFQAHEGYDGVFLEIPGTGTHLEFTTGGGHHPPSAHPESLIVLYLDTQDELDIIEQRIAQPRVVPSNPYWQRNARAYADPDGFQLLLTLYA